MSKGPENFLKEWRKFRGLSQEKLAELVGTSTGQISMLESGDRGLTLKWLVRIAPVLETTPGSILDTDPAQPTAEVIDIWDHIPVERRGLAIDVLKRFANEG